MCLNPYRNKITFTWKDSHQMVQSKKVTGVRHLDWAGWRVMVLLALPNAEVTFNNFVRIKQRNYK